MNRIPLPLGQKLAKSQAPLQSVERLLNGYMGPEPTGKEQAPIYGTPGLVPWCTGLDGPARGRLEMTGTAYVVAGTKLYRISAAGVATSLGTIPNTDLVAMAGDGTNVVVVTEGVIYVWNGTALSQVTDSDAPLASSVIWTDGYFLFGEKGSQSYFISALGDPMNYDALDFASAEWKPDNLVTPVLLHRTVYLAGDKTIEAVQNTGGADFPFSRYEGVYVDVGLVGRDAVAVTNDTMFWLASDRTIRRLDGLTATVVSTAPIGRILKSWAAPELTIASNHVVENHLFIVFRNPEGCVVYDQTTGLWHERASYQLPTWRVRHLFDCYGMTLACSETAGTIYKLDPDAFDEDGEVLEMEVVTPYLYAGSQRITVGQVEVIAQTGVGDLTLNPQLTLERTKDGRTWSDRRSRRLGKVGDDLETIRFGAQGQARAMAFRLRITDPVRRAILGAYAEVEVEA